jgi:hypothetical protein
MPPYESDLLISLWGIEQKKKLEELKRKKK